VNIWVHSTQPTTLFFYSQYTKSSYMKELYDIGFYKNRMLFVVLLRLWSCDNPPVVAQSLVLSYSVLRPVINFPRIQPNPFTLESHDHEDEIVVWYFNHISMNWWYIQIQIVDCMQKKCTLHNQSLLLCRIVENWKYA
jgi:hypothetical protein